MIYYSIGIVFLAVLLTGISQVLLKIGAMKRGNDAHFITSYLNCPTIVAYSILFGVTVISVIALIDVPLKIYYAIASLNFVVVAMLSRWLLKESLSKGRACGVMLIFIGVVIFNV